MHILAPSSFFNCVPISTDIHVADLTHAAYLLRHNVKCFIKNGLWNHSI